MKESNYNIWVEDKENTYVFNSMRGSLLSMTHDEVKSFKSFINNQSRIISPDLLDKMARGYMIIPDETNDQLVWRRTISWEKSLNFSFRLACQRYNVTYTADIITNGYLLDEDTCKELFKCRIKRAQITVDGPPRGS